MGAIALNIDRRGKYAVISESNTGKVDPLPNLALGDTGQEFIVKVLDPTGNSAAPFYEKPDLSAYGLRIAVCASSVGGTLGAVLALATSFAYDSTAHTFTGSIDLSTAGLTAALATLPEATFKLEITLTGAGRQHILTKDVIVQAVADISGSTAPAPADSYYNTGESNQRFLKKRGEPGETFTLVSPDGTKEITIGCDNDGVLTQNQADV